MSDRKIPMRSNQSMRISEPAAWFILSAIAMALAVPPIALGDSIGSVRGTLTANDLSGLSPGSISCDQCVISSSTGLPEDIFSNVTATYNGVTFSSVTGNGSASGGYGSSGEATLHYDFEVLGSVQSVTAVPELITFTLLTDETAAGGPDSSTAAEASFTLNSIGTTYCTFVPAVTGCGYQSSALINETTTFYASPGSAVPISIQIEGSAFNGTWAATADPSLEIDPGFPDAADFSLEVSPIPLNSTVPEPRNSLPLGCALLALSRMGVQWRKRKQI
jgi:hypothetical protein